MVQDLYQAKQPGSAGNYYRLIRRYIALFLLGALSLVPLGSVHAEQDYLDPDDAFRLSSAVNVADHIDLHFEIAPGYYMYRERFEIESSQADAVKELDSPEGLHVYDPNFDKDMEIYRDAVTLRLPLNTEALTGAPLVLDVISQGCADAGLCYTPSTQRIDLVAGAQGYEPQGEFAAKTVPTPQEVAARASSDASNQPQESAFAMSDVGLAQYLQQANWYTIILLSFAFGVLLSFTPCVLPMVPILLSIIAGQQGQQQGKQSRTHGLLMAFAFVLGLSLIYTLLGVAAGLLGAGLAAWLQTPWVLGFFALLLGLFGLAMLDVFTLQLPSALQGRLNARLTRIPGGRFSGVFLMGMLSALIVGPCVAAPLAGVLLFISQTGDVVLGGSALFALAWGSGVLLLILGAGSGVMMPKAGAWMNHVKTLFAVMLFATAWWMIAQVLPAWLGTVGWTLLLLWVAVLLGVLQRVELTQPIQALRQAVALLLALWAAFVLFSVAVGKPSLLHPLQGVSMGGSSAVQVSSPRFERITTLAQLQQRVAQAQRPVMLDFYADWCVSCIEMEKFTFSDPAVAQLMQQFDLLQVDVTANTAEDRELLKHFSLFGPPGILFYDAQGQYLDSQRVIGFKNAQQFAQILERVQAGS